MAIDFLGEWPGWNSLELSANQEQATDSGGRVYVRNFSDPLWKMSAQTKRLSPNALDEWRARLDALENGLVTFKAFALSRAYPIAYPNGAWPTGGSFSGTTAQVHTVGADNKSLRVKGLPAGFVLSRGDMIQVGDTDLYRLMETATADGGGITPSFEVRPHLWDGIAVNDAVSVKRPACLMVLVPGSVQAAADTSGRGAVSFQAIEAR